MLPIVLLFMLPILGLAAPAADDSIIYESFAKCLQRNRIPAAQVPAMLYSPTNPAFSDVLNAYVRNLRFNTTATKKPSIIATPVDIPAVQATVVCTKEAGLQLKTRSGGHDYEGISYVSANPFVILDLFHLRNITFDMPTQTAWVQAGALLGELYYAISKQSNVLAFPAGVCPTVGAGGHISGGGYGPLIRKHGLTVDHVVDAQIIDVNGKVLDRKGMGEDLFWAIRGGGGASFGVILAYKINLVPVPPVVTVFNVQRTRTQNASDILVQYQNTIEKWDDNLFIRVLIQPVTVDKSSNKSVRITLIGEFLGNPDGLLPLMNTHLPTLGLTKADLQEMSWVESMLFWANYDNATSPEALNSRVPHDGVGFLKRKSDYVQKPIPKEGLESLFDKMIELGKVGLVFNSYGGKMSQIPEDATPFPHRAGILYKIQYSVNWHDTSDNLTKEYLGEAVKLHEFMTPFVTSNPRQAFFNYRDIDIGSTTNGNNTYEEGKVYGVKYFKNNFDRLVKIKTAVDPTNFFRTEQSIPPLPK
ncbi:OLC1v1033552C1 [Oldenlandia corymbosa var. corymbosa]|uniref:OLC1v1033552C1 n=1 Tax=Oldenlandia corymbosa var. corymbosa TaxID=529605 RepID=A0AAV1CNI6_OLDCO|nr:OLC1v1033552C1 [Oldenlandia corymbosa var. corymbosa]